MNLKKRPTKGSILVMAIGFMMIVSLMTVSKLESLRLNMQTMRNMDYQSWSDQAGRSGIEYGYSMIKNIMEGVSIIGPRFTTKYYGSPTARVGDVPPYWLEVLDPEIDKAAYDLVATNTFASGGVGMDSQILSYVNGSQFNSIDASYAARNPNYLYGANGTFKSITNEIPGADVGLDSMEVVAECPVELLGTPGSMTGSLLIQPPNAASVEKCVEQKNALYGSGNLISSADWTFWSNDSKWNNYHFLWGHFGTNRWHYYSSYDFSPYRGDNVKDDGTDPGTGGIIKADPTGLDPLVSGSDVSWADHGQKFFERLFLYRWDAAATKYPHEPGDWAGTDVDANEASYNVLLHTGMNYDVDAMKSENQPVLDVEDLANTQYKVFFKLWITRDYKRDDYGSGTPSNITTGLVGNNVELRLSDGTYLKNNVNLTPTDLNPIWMVPVDYNPGNQIEDTYWRRDWNVDWYDADGDGDTSELMGVLQWPVPFLARQRGDYDTFYDDSIRGTAAATAPWFAPEYTTFTLWSLGTVKEVKQSVRDLSATVINSDDQKISQFTTVARALYKMEFYMDVRAVDVADDDPISFPQEDDPFHTEPLSACDASKRNEANWAYFSSRLIPICDLGTDMTRRRLTEPVGIYIKGIEKVAYRGSKAGS